MGTRSRWLSLIAGLPLAVSAHAVAQQSLVDSTSIVAPLAGQLATPAPGQERVRRFAPDLGLTDIHQGELRIVFGDAIRIRDGDPISFIRDDIQGHISLVDFPDGDAVDAYVAARAPEAGQPSWQRHGPPIFYRLTPVLQLASRTLLHDGAANGAVFNTGLFKAPVAAFSNALAGDASAFFTIYSRSVPMECTGGESPTCDEGFECDQRLGKIGGNWLEDGVVCVLGTSYCRPVTGGGLCIDRTSSLFHPTLPAGLLQAVVWKQAVGNADRDTPERYYTRPWYTNKYVNLSARTVNDFDPARAHGEGNDYRPTDGGKPEASKVFLWGRAGYVGTKADGRDLQVYFAVADIPTYSDSGELEWAPRYFTRLSPSGVPRFSPNQLDAAPLDLNGSPRAENEVWDVVNQMTISWVESLGAWVMLYGGGANPSLADLFSSGLAGFVRHDPEGAIHARFARQPWGPWSAPQQLFKAGNPNPIGEAPRETSQYAPGGILRHPMCDGDDCAPREATQDPNDYGFLYAPNIIDAWTTPTPKGARIYWNVSTWHPYQVVLLKTEIDRALVNTAIGDAGSGAVIEEEPGATDGGQDSGQDHGSAGAGSAVDASDATDAHDAAGEPMDEPAVGAPPPVDDPKLRSSDSALGCGIAVHERDAHRGWVVVALWLLVSWTRKRRSGSGRDHARSS